MKPLTIFLACSAWYFSAHAGVRPDESIAVVQKKFSAFDQHNVTAIENIYAASAVLNSPDYHQLVGNEPIAETYRKLFNALPDAKDVVERLRSAGDVVYAQYVLSGHWNGAQDKPVNVRIISVYKVSDGHIVDDATYYDRKAP